MDDRGFGEVMLSAVFDLIRDNIVLVRPVLLQVLMVSYAFSRTCHRFQLLVISFSITEGAVYLVTGTARPFPPCQPDSPALLLSGGEQEGKVRPILNLVSGQV